MINTLDKMDTHLLAQQRAGTVLAQMNRFIIAGISEKEIVDRCTQLLAEHGLSQTWYYNVPALAYVGERTTLSMSGREYQATETKVKNEDIITIALSPLLDNCWGALARTYIVEQGTVVTHSQKNNPHAQLYQFQKELHQHLCSMAQPLMSFHDLYLYFNQYIQAAGYINLDYHGNLGHSLENDLAHRKFIEKNNPTLLADSPYFAFETHLGKEGESYGSKYENVYYFSGTQLIALSTGLSS